MALDRERYRQEVVVPARQAGHVPPPDLYVRYAVKGFDEEFASRVAEVVAYWRELKTKRTYARLAEALLTQHAELERAGELTARAFRERSNATRTQELSRLAILIQAEAGGATHVGPATLARLRQAAGGGLTDADVRKALTAAGIQVVTQLPELPVIPPAKYADLVGHLRQLNLDLSPQAVFGADALRAGKGFRVLSGFRLADGRRLDLAAINAAGDAVEKLPYADPRKAPTARVLTILRSAAAEPGRLDELLLWEVLEQLRPFTGFVQKVVASQACDLGLEENEAGLLAAALAAGDATDLLRRQVEEEVAAGRLRSAQQLAVRLPADDPLREHLAERAAEVAALISRAERELAEGRREQAALLFVEAAGLAGDDDALAERAGAIAPPPPRSATAVVNGDELLVSWQPSPSQAGRIRYRVVRGVGRAPSSPGDGTTVTKETGACEARDTEAPVGVDLYYTVFATRGADMWSRGSSTTSTVFAPDVSDVVIDPAETAVTASWRPHPAVESVDVTRSEGHAGPGTPVDASPGGFTDAGLGPGVEYFYRIQAVYRTPDGGRRCSDGVTVSAIPAPAPLPVSDLEVRLRPGPSQVLEAFWTPPAHGLVELWIGTTPGAQGSRVAGIPQKAPQGRVVLELDPPKGRHYLTAVTRSGRRVVTGESVELGTAEPVTGLVAERQHDRLRVSWIWPSGATEAVVVWDGGEMRCSRRVYEDEGGLTLTVGPDETGLAVRAVHPHPAGELLSFPATIQVEGRGAAVHYRMLSAGVLRRRQRIIELTADRSCDLPALVVVQGTGQYAPDGPGEGTEIARIPPQPITSGVPLKVPVELRSGGGWLGVFAIEELGVLVFPPPLKERRIR